MARIADGFDEFGNPESRAFDLGGGDEDRIRGESILLYICKISGGVFAEREMQALMAERGLRLDIRHAPVSGRCPLDARMLAGYTQLWFVSGDTPTLNARQVKMIVDYVRSGNGLAIWADNKPYYADANLLVRALTGSSFSGNRQGDGVMVPGPPNTNGRFVEHQLTQGSTTSMRESPFARSIRGPASPSSARATTGSIASAVSSRRGSGSYSTPVSPSATARTTTRARGWADICPTSRSGSLAAVASSSTKCSRRAAPRSRPSRRGRSPGSIDSTCPRQPLPPASCNGRERRRWRWGRRAGGRWCVRGPGRMR